MTHRVVPYGLMVTKDSVAQSIYVKLRIQAKQNSNEKSRNTISGSCTCIIIFFEIYRYNFDFL